MPEGDVVWRTAADLHDALAGRELVRSDFRVPRFATADLTGRAVTETVSRGKHLLTRVEGDITVHTHLKMEGALAGQRRVRASRCAITGSGSSWPTRSGRPWAILLGIVEVVRTSKEDLAVGHLGPDLLGPGWDAA